MVVSLLLRRPWHFVSFGKWNGAQPTARGIRGSAQQRRARASSRFCSMGQREVRGPQWDQNTLCAAQRAPARCGVRFVLKIAPNTALGPPTKPQCHLARCYRRLGSIVDADTRRGASKNDNESKGRERGRSCRPRLRSAARAWTDSGPGSWTFTYIRALPSIYIRRRQHAVCGFAALGYVQAVRRARMTDAGRPSTDTSPALERPRRRPISPL